MGESKSIFEKMGNSVGIASCLNTIAQVHKGKNDIPEALNAAREAQRLFEEEQDAAGAEVAAFLVESLQATDRDNTPQQAEDATAAATAPKGEGRCGLPDLLHGGITPSITILAMYDAFESRQVGSTGKKPPTAADAAEKKREEEFVP